MKVLVSTLFQLHISETNSLEGNMTRFQALERRQENFSERSGGFLELLCLSRSHMLLLGLPTYKQQIHGRLARGTVRVVKLSRTFNLACGPGNRLEVGLLHPVHQRIPEAVQVNIPLGKLLRSKVVWDWGAEELGHGVRGQHLRRRDGRAERCEEGD